MDQMQRKNTVLKNQEEDGRGLENTLPGQMGEMAAYVNDFLEKATVKTTKTAKPSRSLTADMVHHSAESHLRVASCESA